MAKSSSQPRIAAVMAAHNADSTLLQAVESLRIDDVPIDIFIVDDASRNPVQGLFKKVPPYVHILRQDKNVGAAKARNVALREILKRGYEYAAVMDSDDIALPGRIAKTIDYLDKHPQVAAVGAWAHCVHEDTLEQLFDLCHPTSPEQIYKRMFIDSRFVHSTVTFRTTCLRDMGMYDESFPVSQDYELLMRICQKYPMANLPEFLLKYRLSSSGISGQKMTQQRLARLRIQLKYFNGFKIKAWSGLVKSMFRLLVPNSLIRYVKGIVK